MNRSGNLLAAVLLAICIASALATSCSEQWECQQVSSNYNFVRCEEGQCVCRADLGFTGDATVANPCGCEHEVYWGQGNPYCKDCQAPRKIIYDNGLPYCVDPEECEAESQTGAFYTTFFGVEELVRTRCSLNQEEQVFAAWTGSAFSFAPAEPQQNVFNFVGMNVARCFQTANGGYSLVSREVMLYTDPQTGEVLRNWTNPWTNEILPVVHVANDPVRLNFPPGPFYKAEVTDNIATFVQDIPLYYPNSLGSDPAFAEYSPQTFYLAGEFFKLSAPVREISNPSLSQTSKLHIAWFRQSLWLPFMKLGDKPGHLLFSGFGSKVASFEKLPIQLQTEISQKIPSFMNAPETIPTVPNESSWTYFKKYFNEYLEHREFPIPE